MYQMAETRNFLTILNDFWDFIAKDIYEIGKTYVEMKIEEEPNSKPVICKPYKFTIEDRLKFCRNGCQQE